MEATTQGVPQGGPLSPLLANIMLDPLDKELERRGTALCAVCRRLCATSAERADELALCVTEQLMREKKGPSGPADRSRSQITFGGCGQKPWS